MQEYIDFNKGDGLVPAIIQCSTTKEVLMLGYMNQEAYNQSIQQNRVTFYSRSKKRLWTKGETSANYLSIVQITLDCDKDALLIQVQPQGPVCHTGNRSCFNLVSEQSEDTKEDSAQALQRQSFVLKLEKILLEKLQENQADSYTATLASRGINKVAQKVGEEAVELVIEAMRDEKELFLNEAADLLYHYLLLLRVKGYSLLEVEQILQQRHLDKTK
ncbi:bifunctional phosphoribosyl-AMP cyclohydrolase/phosphoribosyl-ATP diphosphatase HisIE [Myroides sp. LJL115]